MERIYKLLVTVMLGLLGACATYGEKEAQNFNATYNQKNVLDPSYTVKQLPDSQKFLITVHQGRIFISAGSIRFAHLTDAANLIAKRTCSQNGFETFKSEWRKDGDDGWVHLAGYFECQSSMKNDKKLINNI